tara:strand:- start:941 stop:2125 length:1185 start_codon:yes stop_codon:yes gene_type:complete
MSTKKTDVKTVWFASSFIFLAHFVIDSAAQFPMALIPVLREKIGFSLTLAGFMISVQASTSAISQPLTALVIDRWPRVPWLPIGLVGCTFCFSAIGWISSYTSLLVLMFVGGMFFAFTHPDMGARAGRLSQEGNSVPMSLFVTGGRIGFAVGPLIAISVTENFGLKWLTIYGVFGIVAAFFVMISTPRVDKESISEGSKEIVLFSVFKKIKGDVISLFVIGGVRAIVVSNLAFFLTSMFVDENLGLWEGGLTSTLFFIGGAFGVILGGIFADWYGRRLTIILGIIVSLIAMFLFLIFPLKICYLFVGFIGFGVFVPMGLSIILTQEKMPGNRAFASSLILGGGWIIASLTAPLVAWLGEIYGLKSAQWILMLFLFLALFCGFSLERDKKSRIKT